MTGWRVLVADWSGAGSPSPARPAPNAIWLALADPTTGALQTFYHRTRAAAEAHITLIIAKALQDGARLLIAADVAFGFPAGFATALTGQPHALAVWDWLATRIEDAPDNRNTHRHIAAMANAAFAGDGPFWGNGTATDITGLARTRPALPVGLSALRATERAAAEGGLMPKPVWQLAGAGAVGAQTLLAIPMFARLRARFAPNLAIWPLDAAATAPNMAPIIATETYLSLLTAEIDALRPGRPGVHDENQVTVFAAALAEIAASGALPNLLQPPATIDAALLAEEGWIVGVGQEGALRAAALHAGPSAFATRKRGIVP